MHGGIVKDASMDSMTLRAGLPHPFLRGYKPVKPLDKKIQGKGHTSGGGSPLVQVKEYRYQGGRSANRGCCNAG